MSPELDWGIEYETLPPDNPVPRPGLEHLQAVWREWVVAQ